MPHTPGPWVYDHNKETCIEPEVCFTGDIGGFHKEADGRLAAAAPTTLDALRLCLKATEGYVGPGHVEAYNAVRYAIEVATGEERVDTTKSEPEAVAFARLSGAAPDLLEALVDLREAVAQSVPERKPSPVWAKVLKADDAIAKAKGAA